MSNVQEAVLEGVGREGAPGPSVLESLYKTPAVARWLVIEEVPANVPHLSIHLV